VPSAAEGQGRIGQQSVSADVARRSTTESSLRLPFIQGSRAIGVIGLAAALVASAPRTALAQNRAAYPDTQPIKPRVELFGQLVTDVIYDFEQNNPNWFDVVRP